MQGPINGFKQSDKDALLGLKLRCIDHSLKEIKSEKSDDQILKSKIENVESIVS